MYVKSDCSFLFNRWKVGHSDPCLSHVQSRGGGGRGRNRSRCKRGERQTIPNGNNYSQIFSVAFLPWNGTFKLFWCIRRLIVSFTAARGVICILSFSLPSRLIYRLIETVSPHLFLNLQNIICRLAGLWSCVFVALAPKIMLIPLEIFIL